MNYNAVICVVKNEDKCYGTYYSELNCNMDVLHEWYNDNSEVYYEYDDRGRLIHEIGIVHYDPDMNHEIWYEYNDNDQLIHKCYDDNYEEWRIYNNDKWISTKSRFENEFEDVIIYFSNVNGYMMVDNNLNLTVREYDNDGRMTRFKNNEFEDLYEYNDSYKYGRMYYKRIYKDGRIIERYYE